MNYLFFSFAILFSYFDLNDNVFTYFVETENRSQIQLNELRGKKILILILPSTKTSDDSLWLKKIDSISTANQNTLAVMAVPSIEDGYVGDVQEILSTWYRSVLNDNIIITKPLKTHLGSGSEQTGIFQWLSHSDKNGIVDKEIEGGGSMFFINEEGNLQGLFGPEVKWSNKIFAMMLQ